MIRLLTELIESAGKEAARAAEQLVSALFRRALPVGTPTPSPSPTCDDLALHERISIVGIRIRSGWSEIWRTKILRPGAWFVAVIVALTGVGTALRTQEVPSADAWKAGSWLSYALLALSSLSAIAYVLVILGYGRALKKSDQNSKLSGACKDVAALLAERATLDYADLGVHVWTLRGPMGFRHLERRAQFILKRRRQTSVVWRKGKGAMGLCWKRNATVIADIERLEQRYPTEADFCSQERDTRFGLTWKELDETRHYRAILAIPLRSGPAAAPRFRGVLSVDVKVNGKTSELRQLLTENQLSNVLSVCEDVLGKPSVEA